MTRATHPEGSARRMKVLLIGLLLLLVAVAFTTANTSREPRPDAVTAKGLASTASGQVASRPSPLHAAAPSPKLEVAFRLDPGVTSGLYLGERWVAPPTFLFAQPGTRYTVRAKVRSVDGHGEPTDLSGDWSTNAPDMIAISRGQGEVTIVVRQPGRGEITVATGDGTKVLQVTARRVDDSMEVGITQ